MGLDAHVRCDCFERGRLRSSPPSGCKLVSSEDGSLLCGSEELENSIAFDRWQQSEACEHQNCQLVSHYLGNIALVADLREELGRWPGRFPVILTRVIYNGIHCGDFIPAEEVPQLIPEIESLAGVHCADPEMEKYMRAFEMQMKDLVESALRVGKVIVF